MFKMDAVEFLTMLCYLKDKRVWEKAEMERYKKAN